MSSTVLALVQEFTDQMSLPTPAALIGATDKGTAQYRALLKQTVRDLTEYRWQQQMVRGSFVSVAGNDQGVLETLLPGYQTIVEGTIWNETRRMKVYGPLTDQLWAALTILPNAGPEFQSWVSGNHFFVSPPFVVGETITATYRTNFGVLGAGTTPQESITADTDTLVFPDNVALSWFKYRWLKQKGVAGWEDDYNDAIALVSKNIVKDGAPTFNLDTPCREARPGITIPAGSWNV